MIKGLIFWILAIVLTLSMVIYQRMTGPTYPVRGKVELGGETIRYKLIRTYETIDNAEISIEEPTGKIEGKLTYKRFKSFDSLTTVPMIHQGGKLVAYLPQQPAAGKMEYWVVLSDGTTEVNLTEEPVILRYKGVVPKSILLPHIFLIVFCDAVFNKGRYCINS